MIPAGLMGYAVRGVDLKFYARRIGVFIHVFAVRAARITGQIDGGDNLGSQHFFAAVIESDIEINCQIGEGDQITIRPSGDGNRALYTGTGVGTEFDIHYLYGNTIYITKIGLQGDIPTKVDAEFIINHRGENSEAIRVAADRFGADVQTFPFLVDSAAHISFGTAFAF